MDHFKLLPIKFKTYADLCGAEAFFIRPSLNDQKDHKTFAQF